MKTINKFLATALDCYPHNLEMAIEALDYSLSYDENCTTTLCLYGRLMTEQLQKFEEAKVYFERALAVDIHAVEVYPFFVWTLIRNEDYEQAKKLCEFASTVKGVNKLFLSACKIELFERMRLYDEAEKAAKEAKMYHASSWHLSQIEDAEKRIKLKRKLTKELDKPRKDKKSRKKAAK